MVRFIACQETCTHAQNFKESIGNVIRCAIGRQYPFNLVMSVWKTLPTPALEGQRRPSEGVAAMDEEGVVTL